MKSAFPIALCAVTRFCRPLPAQTNLFVAADGTAPFKSVDAAWLNEKVAVK